MSAVFTIDLGQVFTGLAALVAALGVATPSFLAWRAAKRVETGAKAANETAQQTSITVQETAAKLAEVNDKTDALHIQGNSNLQKMNAMAEQIGNQKGRNEEKAERKAEDDAEGMNPL